MSCKLVAITLAIFDIFFAFLAPTSGSTDFSFLKIIGFCYCFVDTPRFFHARLLWILTIFGGRACAPFGFPLVNKLCLWCCCACCFHSHESNKWTNRKSQSPTDRNTANEGFRSWLLHWFAKRLSRPITNHCQPCNPSLSSSPPKAKATKIHPNLQNDTCGIRAHAGRPHRLSRPTP